MKYTEKGEMSEEKVFAQELSDDEREKISGGGVASSAGFGDSIHFEVRLFRNDEWMHTCPFYSPNYRTVLQIKKSLVGLWFVHSPDQVRLYRSDGVELVDGMLWKLGICDGDTIKGIVTD